MSAVDREVETPDVEVVQAPQTLLGRLSSRRMAVPGLFAAVAIVWIVFQITTSGLFISSRNLVDLMRQSSVIAIVALGLLVVILMGEIDLSVGSMLGMCAMVTAITESTGHVPFWVTIVFVLSIGALAGLWNGLWTSRFGMPSFVVTLGGLLIFRGIVQVISHATTVSGIRTQITYLGDGEVQGIWLVIFLAAGFAVALVPLLRIRSAVQEQRGPIFRKAIAIVLGMIGLSWASLSFGGLPVPAVFVFALAVALSWVLENTVWGRHVYAVGGNRAASRVAGIRIRRHVIVGFVLVGLMTAFAAILFEGRLGSAAPDTGTFLELNAISAVIIGGASLFGGSGKVSGVLLGTLLTQSLLNGMSLMNISTSYQNITRGGVLMIAVLLDVVSKRGGRIFVRG